MYILLGAAIAILIVVLIYQGRLIRDLWGLVDDLENTQ